MQGLRVLDVASLATRDVTDTVPGDCGTGVEIEPPGQAPPKPVRCLGRHWPDMSRMIFASVHLPIPAMSTPLFAQAPVCFAGAIRLLM